MKIEFVNHASYIVEWGKNKDRLITDPWLSGSAFNHGWSHISKTKFQYEDFKNIKYIWFSHEHPDHFSPKDINKIPEEIRSEISVLYQKTNDKKVLEFCKKKFKDVIELTKNRWIDLDESIKIFCSPFGVSDSYMALSDGNTTILNLNDCVLHDEKSCYNVKKLIGKVDVLFSQFSFATWVGNKSDSINPSRIAFQKLKALKMQSEIFETKFIIPFASFIYFSRAENKYLNKYVNTIGDTYNYLKKNIKAKPIIMYPGDSWKLYEKYLSENAINQYNQDYLNILNQKSLELDQVSIKKLKELFNIFIKRINKKNTFLIRFIPSTKVYLHDINKTVKLSYVNNIEIFDGLNHPDIITSSNDLAYCLEYEWGANTLNVNGCFQVPDKGNYFNFKRFMSVPSFNNHGKTDVNVFKTWARRLIS